MKWFKHYSDALDDPFICALMDEFGHTGYVVWFGLIEIIAKESGNNLTGKLDISPTYLRRKLRTSQTKLRQVFTFCQTFDKVSFTFSEMLELKDNYTKDLQGTGKKLSKHKEVRSKSKIKKKKEIKKKMPPQIDEVILYFKEKGKPEEMAQAFFDHFTANGWIRGKAKLPIVDWKAAARTWIRNAKEWAAENVKSEQQPTYHSEAELLDGERHSSTMPDDLKKQIDRIGRG
jgi:hypothetical protein